LALMVVGAAAVVPRKANKAAVRAVELICIFILSIQPSFVKLCPATWASNAHLYVYTLRTTRGTVETEEFRPYVLIPRTAGRKQHWPIKPGGASACASEQVAGSMLEMAGNS
jgi:hypothetical protein